MTKSATSPRLILPDLARGLALLGIAAANSATAWLTNGYNLGSEPGHTVGGVRPDSGLDQFLAVLSTMFVHVRGLPMFSTLLGFGLGLVTASLYRKHYPQAAARKVLARRYVILALFGLAHMLLVFYVDIMFIYGLIGVILALLFPVQSKSLRIIAYIILVGSALLSTLGAVGMYFAPDIGVPASRVPTTEITSVGTYFAENARAGGMMIASTPFAVLQLLGLAIIGYVWAREGYLVNVDKHRRVLTTWVLVAVAIILLIGLPWGLSAIGVIDPRLETPLMLANTGIGLFTGPGILAFFALLTKDMTTNPRWAYPFVALGKRSMSGYLAQSFLFILLAMPFGFGLGLEASVSGKLGVGLLVWLITLALATALEAAGRQGPFEWAHRHLSYGRTGALQPFENSSEKSLAR
ncbi:Uncharacterized membrane protein YeiB [Corynebacterium mycetoides]|uniref:Uncharacterized membrane protein YeiB n=1 Tax=Corynebacterium mycetoides TaxID=38302 RepID=A0A1G9L5V8_9CORY|nr:DUF418 domain-containing protein [Corynebacterium mycetoides]SDL57369.1 Uncharacterized membrane protein YeiB [Corynebacterium mycetoides]